MPPFDPAPLALHKRVFDDIFEPLTLPGYGCSIMTAIARGAIDAGLKVLDGTSDAALVRMSDLITKPDCRRVMDASAEHERQIAKRLDRLSRQRR